MPNSDLKLKIRRDQLTWFLDLLLDEREIFQLSASASIVPDFDRLYALSKRELLASLTDAFLGVTGDPKIAIESDGTYPPKSPARNSGTSVEELVSQFFTEKAQEAISRVGYMEVSEIETFFKTSEVLIETGDFAEIVWALLTDKRREVVEHGYKLLNRTYESLEEPHINGQETLPNTEQLKEIQPHCVHTIQKRSGNERTRPFPKLRSLNNNWQIPRRIIPRLSRAITCSINSALFYWKRTRVEKRGGYLSRKQQAFETLEEENRTLLSKSRSLLKKHRNFNNSLKSENSSSLKKPN